jgi:hypothetical protein
MLNREAFRILKFLHQIQLQENKLFTDKSYGWTPIEDISRVTNIHSNYVRARTSYLQYSGFAEYDENNDKARITKDGTSYIRDRWFKISQAYLVPIFIPIISGLISFSVSWWMQRTERKKAEIYREETRRIAGESLIKAENANTISRESNKIAQSSLQSNMQPQIAIAISANVFRPELELDIRNYGNVAYNIQVLCNLGNMHLDYLGMREWESRTTYGSRTTIVPKTDIMNRVTEYTEKQYNVTEPYEGWSSFEKSPLNLLGVNAYVSLSFELPADCKQRIENKEIIQGTFNYEDRSGTKHSISFESNDLKKLTIKTIK